LAAVEELCFPVGYLNQMGDKTIYNRMKDLNARMAAN
jgi:hypothetical protein